MTTTARDTFAKVARSWRYVRAGLITAVLVLALISGLPARLPKLVRNWPPRLAAVVLLLPAWQQKLLAPFTPLSDLLGLRSEDWRLFTGTGGTRYRMWIEGRRANGDYKLLYRPHDPEHAYLDGALEYRRVFNLWNPHRGWISSSYPGYTRWLARRIFHDYRRLRTVRVRMEEIAIEPGGRGFVPSGHFVYEEVVPREEVTP